MSKDEDEASDELSSNEFAYFRLTGDRFNPVGMPAETAREVGYFREAVVAEAKEVWLERNPDRSRVPAGFEAAFDLRLIGVGEGSARPQMMLHRRLGQYADDDWNQYADVFAEARDRVTGRLRQVETSRSAEDLSPAQRRDLGRIGASLDGPERITLGHPTDSRARANLDLSTRQILRTIEEVLPTTPVAHELEGVVSEYDGSSLSFQLKTPDGIATCVLEHFNNEIASYVRNVLALDGITAPDVIVEGETLDIGRKPVHLFNVHRVEVVRTVGQKALMVRLSEIRALENGWWGPQSSIPTTDVLERLDLLIEDLAAMGLDVDLIPSTDGAVVVELRRGDVELAGVIEPGARMVLIVDNIETDALAESDRDWDRDVFLEFLKGRINV